METSFPGSLKAEQDANFALFTTHALLPIFPEASWVQEWIRIRVGGKFDLITDTCGRGNFWIRTEKVADSKFRMRVDGALNKSQCMDCEPKKVAVLERWLLVEVWLYYRWTERLQQI